RRLHGRRDLRARHPAEPRVADRDGAGPRQQDVYRASGRPVRRRNDQGHHPSSADHRAGSQRSPLPREAARGPQAAAVGRGRQTVTISKRLVVLVPLVMAHALANASSAAPEPGAAGIQLKTISARNSGKGASLVIEATEPAAYVATRPDPLTIYVDFRNVGTAGVANKVSNDDKSPIA